MKQYINKIVVALVILLLPQMQAIASSHREAPLISMDPLADNTDLYAFRSPCDTNNIVIIANYIPFEHPAGGPNWYNFGENIRYEIHIKNKSTGTTDDITYRFTFTHTNQDPTTFFNIRLGQQNIKAVYTCEKSTDGGVTWATIKTGGVVPPPNIGPRSITSPVGLNATGGYDSLMMAAVTTASSGEKLFCGPIDDPFFVDLGGAFDVGGFRNSGRDGVAKFNCHSIVMEIPISSLQASGLSVSSATNILDPNFVIGVWASASRPQITTLDSTGGSPVGSGGWVQVSRLGMPLTNEVIIPIGEKDRWNGTNPYTGDAAYEKYFSNPELGLYLNNETYGAAVPGLSALNIQTNSLGSYDFRNGAAGLYSLKYTTAVLGTALDPVLGYGNFLLPDATSPRAVDILPIFYTGVPNLIPYQLATGKTGGPLSAGKPFINNFLPTISDMLRLNMAVPPTSRTDPKFSSLGIVSAAALGLTDTLYNTSSAIQRIPNMDGFPNGRRLEDDVTTIELQAVSGVALAAIGLWYDDYTGTGSPVTPTLVSVLSFNAGVTHNDTTFKSCFPYVQDPWQGFNGAGYVGPTAVTNLNLTTPEFVMVAYPNPFASQISFRYKMTGNGNVKIQISDINGRTVQLINEGSRAAGEYVAKWNSSALATGTYFANLSVNNSNVQTMKLVKTN